MLVMVVNMFSRMKKLIGQEDRAHGAIVCRYLLVLAASKASCGIRCNGRPLISQLRAHEIRPLISLSSRFFSFLFGNNANVNIAWKSHIEQ